MRAGFGSSHGVKEQAPSCYSPLTISIIQRQWKNVKQKHRANESPRAASAKNRDPPHRGDSLSVSFQHIPAQISFQLLQPLKVALPDGQKLPVPIFCHLHKAVIVEFRFIAASQRPEKRRRTSSRSMSCPPRLTRFSMRARLSCAVSSAT